MAGPSMRQLRSWHQRLSTAHGIACDVAEEAEAALGYNEAVIILDPIVELHAALSVIEGLIEDRKKRTALSPKNTESEHD